MCSGRNAWRNARVKLKNGLLSIIKCGILQKNILCDNRESITMKHIKTLSSRSYKESMKKGGCGECQTSCQSACKTSCTVGNQTCENK